MAHSYKRLHLETHLDIMDTLDDVKADEKGQELLTFIYALHNMKQKSSKSLDYKLKALFASQTDKVLKKANKLLRTVSTEVCPDDSIPLDLKDAESFKQALRDFGIEIIKARSHRSSKKAVGAIAAFIKNWNSLVEATEGEFLFGHGIIHCSQLRIHELTFVSGIFNELRKRGKRDGYPEALTYFKDEDNLTYVLASITIFQGSTILAKRRGERERQRMASRLSLC